MEYRRVDTDNINISEIPTLPSCHHRSADFNLS